MKLAKYKRYLPTIILTIVLIATVSDFFINAGNNSKIQNGESLADGNVPGASLVAQLNNTGTAVPANIKSLINYNSVTIIWDKVTGATGYDIEVDGKVVENILTPRYLHEGLLFDTQHKYRVRSRRFGKVGEWSSLLTVTTADNNFSDIPTNFQAVVHGTYVVTSWDSVVDALGYDIEVDGVVLDNKTENVYTHTNLDKSSVHNYRVRARFADRASQWTQIIKVTVIKEHPKYVKMHVTVDGKLDDWDKKSISYSDEKAGYYIYSAQDEKRLFLAVKGHNAGGRGTFYIDSDESRTTGYRISEWKNAGIDYIIDGTSLYKYSGKGEDWNWEYVDEIKLVNGSGIVEGVVDLQLLGITDLPQRLRIGYVIGGLNYLPAKGAEMALSYTEITFDTRLLTQPENLTASSTSADVNLKWDKVVGADSYEIEVDGKIVGNSIEAEFKYRNAGANVQHNFRVRTVIDGRKSEWSNPLMLITGQMLSSPAVIIIDGDSKDWSKVKGIAGDASDKYHLKVIQDNANIYFSVNGGSLEGQAKFFIDSDCNGETGYKSSGWKYSGADFLVDGTGLYKYSGAGDDWSWEFVKAISFSKKSGFMEFSIYHSDIGKNGYGEIDVAFSLNDIVNVPERSYPMGSAYQLAAFEPELLSAPINIHSSSTQGTIVLEWDKVNSVSGYMVEMDGISYDNKESNRFEFRGLEPLSKHKFRVRCRLGNNFGEWSSFYEGTTKGFSEIKGKMCVDGNVSDWKYVQPLAMGNISINSVSAAIDRQNVYVLIQGNYMSSNMIYLDIDGKSITGFGGSPWNYAGIDYMLEGNNLYKYSGSGAEWKWKLVSEIESYSSETVTEVAIPLTMMGMEKPKEVYLGCSSGDLANLPASGQLMLPVNAFLDGIAQNLTIPQNLLAIANNRKINISWNKVFGANEYELEADGQIIYSGSATTFVHSGLQPNSLHKYRIRAKNSIVSSNWSGYITKNTLASEFSLSLDGATSEWSGIDPLCIGKGNIESLYAVVNYDRLSIMTKGKGMFSYANIYIDSDSKSQTGYTQTVWKDSGADYMIEQNMLYKYTGTGKDWVWQYMGEVPFGICSDNAYELYVPLSSINANSKAEISVGAMKDDTDCAPLEDNEMTKVFVVY